MAQHDRRDRRDRPGRRPPPPGDLVVEVVGLGGLGDVVARGSDGAVWYLQGPPPDAGEAELAAWLAALPGARVAVRPLDARKRRAAVGQVRAASPWPPQGDCAAAGRCGGCAWRHVPAELARREKRARIERLFAPYGVEVALQIPAPGEPGTRRRRARLHARQIAGGLVEVGFCGRRSDAVVSAPSCPALTDGLDALRGWLADALSPWCLRGEVHAVEGDEGVVLAIDARPAHGRSPPTADGLLAAAPARLRVRGVQLRTPAGANDAGEATVTLAETADDPTPVTCSARGFAQATAWGNRAIRAAVDAALRAERTARGGARFGHGRELYAGSGNLTAVARRHGDRWTTVEQDAGAVRRAKASGQAGVRALEANVDAHIAGLVAQRQLAPDTPPDDVWLLDPARPGARLACAGAATLRPAAVVYVSCSPETLRRDVDVLSADGLRLVSLVAIDAFPGTPHVEVVAHLSRSDTAAGER
jgi:23S rRNA (uracil1939-C5)-methyltransferase